MAKHEAAFGRMEYLSSAGIEAKALTEAGSFEGYASVYGNRDGGGDIVAPGAFDDSLSRRPASKVKMLFNHDRDRIVGTWEEMFSDSTGLRVKGQLLIKTAAGRDAYEQAKAGALDAMSIGYRTIEDEWDRETETRTIRKAELIEVSLVTFPMNGLATITGVKSLADEINELNTLSDMERFLRDAGTGLSRKDATGFVSRLKAIIQREAASDQEQLLLKQLVARLRG